MQGDAVQVISGRERGKVGEITKIFKHDSSVIVKDLNLNTKHVKSREEGEPGQIIKLSSQGPTHDEIDFEFLRNLSGDPYILRTNIFTQGKGCRPTFWKIKKHGSTEDFSSLPYICTLLNCSLWTYYGIIKAREYLVATVNGFGIVVETIYVILFLIYAPKGIRGRTAILAVILDVAISAEAVATSQLALQGEAHGGALYGFAYSDPLDIFSTNSWIKYLRGRKAMALLLRRIRPLQRSISKQLFGLEKITDVFKALALGAFAVFITHEYMKI
ncbi:hypothetical protein JHK84_054806 [Glycine max]|nr:hypothetical protein JHK84_054806 [Glycine max]